MNGRVIFLEKERTSLGCCGGGVFLFIDIVVIPLLHFDSHGFQASESFFFVRMNNKFYTATYYSLIKFEGQNYLI